MSATLYPALNMVAQKQKQARAKWLSAGYTSFHMNGYHRTLITVGIVLCLMPFIAVPYAWKGWLSALCGVLVLLCTLMLSRTKRTAEIPQ